MRRHADKSPSAALAKPQAHPQKPASEALEERIDRLEKRLDEVIDEPGMLHPPKRAELDLDVSEAGDPLRRAVERSNGKRGPG